VPPIVEDNGGARLDFWTACDDTNCHLFFSDGNGHIYRASTPVGHLCQGMDPGSTGDYTQLPWHLGLATDQLDLLTQAFTACVRSGNDPRGSRSPTSSQPFSPPARRSARQNRCSTRSRAIRGRIEMAEPTMMNG
jgi:hypothetical protein